MIILSANKIIKNKQHFYYVFLEMCVQTLNTLRDHGLIKMDDGFDLKSTGVYICK